MKLRRSSLCRVTTTRPSVSRMQELTLCSICAISGRKVRTLNLYGMWRRAISFSFAFLALPLSFSFALALGWGSLVLESGHFLLILVCLRTMPKLALLSSITMPVGIIPTEVRLFVQSIALLIVNRLLRKIFVIRAGSSNLLLRFLWLLLCRWSGNL